MLIVNIKINFLKAFDQNTDDEIVEDNVELEDIIVVIHRVLGVPARQMDPCFISISDIFLEHYKK